jgi:hypothetical protein
MLAFLRLICLLNQALRRAAAWDDRCERLPGRLSRVLKNRASRRDPALCGFYKCSHMAEYAALSKTPHALVDGLMLVFQHPVSGVFQMICYIL